MYIHFLKKKMAIFTKTWTKRICLYTYNLRSVHIVCVPGFLMNNQVFFLEEMHVIKMTCKY